MPLLAMPLTVHDVAPQHTPLEQASAPQVMAQLFPVHDALEVHAAIPAHAILLLSAFVVTPPMHDDSPVQAMLQVPALHVTLPEHDPVPHETEHVAPAHVTLAHALSAVQSMTQALAALQSTLTSDAPTGVTEHGMPAGQVGHPPVSEQPMTHVPFWHAPTPAQRAAQRAAEAAPPSGATVPESWLPPSGAPPASPDASPPAPASSGIWTAPASLGTFASPAVASGPSPVPSLGDSPRPPTPTPHPVVAKSHAATSLATRCPSPGPRIATAARFTKRRPSAGRMVSVLHESPLPVEAAPRIYETIACGRCAR
jgi:hypothetical protein